VTGDRVAADSGRNVLLDTSWRPDAAELSARLRRWVAARMSPSARVERARFPAEGGSSFNLLFDLVDVDADGGAVTPYVAKLGSPAPRYQTFPDEDLGRQVAFMEVVRAATGLPVPAVLRYERDRSWLGAPFFITPRHVGRAWPSDPPYNFSGWVLESPPADRAAMRRAFVSVLAEIHSVTADRYDLSGLARPGPHESALDGQLRSVRSLYDWARAGRGYPVVEQALRWLAQHRPSRTDPACVTWGDARPGNLLFAGGDVTAVLDWEGATLGHAELDVAFVCVMHRYYQARAEAQGRPGLPELFRPAELAAEYAAVSGRTLTDLRWYQAAGAARAAAIQVRFVERARAAGSGPFADGDQALGMAPILRELIEA
jgi:aminoglycoside phosphotransferase (APT) family kinase protein